MSTPEELTESTEEHVAQEPVLVAVGASDAWLELEHAETGGRTRIPNDPDVLFAHEARGWAVSENEQTIPLPPDPPGGTTRIEAWVELVHPASGGRQLLPNDPSAIASARENGWVGATELAAVLNEDFDPAEWNVADVLEQVGDDALLAAAVLGKEREGKNRVSLIRELEAIAATATTGNTVAEGQE